VADIVLDHRAEAYEHGIGALLDGGIEGTCQIIGLLDIEGASRF
jgi:hypothetical protein